MSEDVYPFLRRVTEGRVSNERLAAVAEHYLHFGGKSPINDQNRALLAAVDKELADHGTPLPCYWGNRNWHPFLTDTLRQMNADGVRRAVCFVTSAYASHAGCRQYLDDIAQARAEVGPTAPAVGKLRLFFDHPGFVEPLAERLAAALRRVRPGAPVAFTAHSIPRPWADTSQYVAQLHATAGLVAARADPTGRHPWRLVYQSRSGRPDQPWLEPDVNDHLRALADAGVTEAVVHPIGFISDHLEVLWDLDVEAQATAERLGIRMVRAATVGCDQAFVAMIRELVGERTDRAEPRSLGSLGPPPSTCPPGCCPG